MYLRRKINAFLEEWKKREDKLPLIIKGSRQIGKTESIKEFSKSYPFVVYIDFVLEPQFKTVFDDGYGVDNIIKNISLINPEFKFVENETLIIFDEIQDCIKCATSLKSFKIDGRFDVICSGSMMGINYNEIDSNSVGYKEDYEMFSLDFEEFLWAKGYSDGQIDEMFQCMKELKPLSSVTMNVMSENFREYIILGGMPNVDKMFIENKNFSGTLHAQKQLLLDYEQDIVKYANGLDKMKILNTFRKIPVFLGEDNKKFRISKVSKNARSRDYIGVVDWLDNAGMINLCYCLNFPCLPLKGNYDPDYFKIYFKDTSFLIASLDEEAQNDLRFNKNFNVYKGAIFENIVGEMLVKQGYSCYFYNNNRTEKAGEKLEMDFFVRDENSLIPVEVKAVDGSTKSLKKLISSEKYGDVKFGIKLGDKNIGFNGEFYTFPYFLTFLLKRFLREKDFPNA